ncbi:division/cell wall cluster transcriptional repressor MraZ [Alkalicoccus urumqiensis]|uniref:Transcriptional regulator MraZ n=1 Tax=Alkalicoccus urumqiensis TaxID=1548213 RepID=A0A2P6MG95_ALKUR|nr:division/cell wall cluster transcriptional repressor MraZ [Alkalicoccus urumqiensis]PRO65322.1 cell division/cell wall cluster transcriptional repressor MraZ [Alkalicoccus urumqiensis]
MFIGEFEHQMDAKGRVTVPSKFRDELGSGFIATRGLDQCLFIYPESEWARLEKKLRDLPFTRKDARAFTRFFFSGATECALDGQNRISLPASLRTYAGLEKECVFIGVAQRVEVWDKALWESYMDESASSFAELAEGLFDVDS